jgi:hypothetical protein
MSPQTLQEGSGDVLEVSEVLRQLPGSLNFHQSGRTEKSENLMSIVLWMLATPKVLALGS